MQTVRNLTRRGGFWHYARRVPRVFSRLDRRVIVRESTLIRVADDPKGIRAQKAADKINQTVEAYWRTLADGEAQDARRRYDEARRISRRAGYEYLPAAEIAKQPLDEIIGRLEALMEGKLLESKPHVSALLGGEEQLSVNLSGLFIVYEALVKAEVADFSPDQLRRWRNPRLRAVANMLSVIGDKPLTQITRADALDYQEWWSERIVAEDTQIRTANKEIGHVSRMIRTIDKRYRLSLKPVFSDLRIEGGAQNSRPPFDPQFVQERILRPGAMSELNDEARGVVYLMAETGLRLSEACNLNERTIVLDGEVPHIQVRPDGRRMKTAPSERDIPLVGVALAAMQKHRNGFPRYRDKSASLSALVNQFFEIHGLRPTEGHSLYSLRHTFEDRLTAVECPEKIQANLMGHKYARPRYGKGPSLNQKREWLQRIAFKPPRV